MSRSGTILLALLGAILLTAAVRTQHRWRTLPQRSNCLANAMAYDPDRKVVVMFGGHYWGVRSTVGGGWMSPSGDQTWEWDGARWHFRRPKHSPSARRGASMAFDPVSRRVLLYGGGTSDSKTGTIFSDTWAWDGQDWVEVTPGGGPGPRVYASMATDPVRNCVVFFGGSKDWDWHHPQQDTWIWDGKFWNSRNPATMPGIRSGAGMAWCARNNRVVMFGGAISMFIYADLHTWEWDGQDWTKHSPKISPNIQHRAYAQVAMCSDPFTKGVHCEVALLSPPGCESWRWDGNAWMQVASTPARQPASGTGEVAEHLGQVVAFGGLSPKGPQDPWQYRETWTFNGSTWKVADTWQGPLTNCTTSVNAVFTYLVEDPGRDRLVTCGAADANGRTRMWALQGYEWEELHPAQPLVIQPGFDLLATVALRHSGEILQPMRNWAAWSVETWKWDGSAWSRVGNQPELSYLHGVAYDSKRKRGVGIHGSVLYEWSESKGAWSKLAVTGAPSLKNPIIEYDPGRDRIVAISQISAAAGMELNEFDGDRWIPASQLPQPPMSYCDAIRLQYVPSLGGVLAFGGRLVSIEPADEAWLWDGIQWTKMPFGSPILSSPIFSATYDSARQRVVCSSGYASGMYTSAELVNEELTADLEHPRPGQRITLRYNAPSKPNGWLLYALSMSQYPGIPFLPQQHFGPQYFPLSPDALFAASLTGPILSSVSANGTSSLPLFIPQDPGFVGFDFHTAALHLQQQLPLSTITNAVNISVIR